MEDLNKRLTKLKIGPWSYRICNDKTYIEVNEAPFLVPKYSIKIDESLNFIVTVYNWPLPDDHNVYINHRRSLRTVFISSLLSGIEDLLCALVLSKIWSRPVCTAYRLQLTKIRCVQVLPKKFTVRKGVTCYHCHCLRRAKNALKWKMSILVTLKGLKKNINVAAKPRAPLSCTHPNKVALALKEKRIECTNRK